MQRVSAWLAVATLLVLGCGETPLKPADHSIPPRTVNQLLSSPSSLSIGGAPVTVAIWIGRAAQSPLNAAAYLDATSDAGLGSISDVYLWVIRGRSEVWATTMSYFSDTPTGGSSYESKQGPQWDIGTHVDAVLGIRAGGTLVRYVLVRDIPIISIE